MKYEIMPTGTNTVAKLVDAVNGLVELHILHGFE